MAKDTLFSSKKTLNLKGRLLELKQPLVMGILNVTPDSFYDGGQYQKSTSVLKRVEHMLQEGADIIDIGGYSSRPAAENISVEEEMDRTTLAISEIVKNFPEAILSLDTFRASVAKAGVEAGAGMINDISGGKLDSEMYSTIAALGVPYVLMHMRGTPQNMNAHTSYTNLVKDIVSELSACVYKAQDCGVKDIIIDPGFGFAKTSDQNYEILKNLDYFKVLNLPLLIGISRKSMIWRKLHCTAKEALNGTTVINTVALMRGAQIIRVHDVKEAVEAVTLTNILRD